MKYSFFFFLLLCVLTRCQTSDGGVLSGTLAIKQSLYIDLYNLNTGRKVLSDTLKNGNFNVGLENFESGVYQAVFSWDRDVVKPQEVERFARQPELGVPKYYISTTFWVDRRESKQYNLSVDSIYKQIELEDILLNDGGSESIHMLIKSDGANNKLYNEYLKLINHYREKNQQHKDNLELLVEHYRSLKLYEQAEKANSRLNNTWLDNVKEELINEEIVFMKKHIESDVIPHIYRFQVNTKEDFKRYIEVYKLFPKQTREKLAAHVTRLL
ncbi:hypothetical protein [Sphingobacterium detergens]|uniref:DUF4369 domain-containing protein n=1 Tax=Sphingobacterium detergens TaxID=1145106 RepID=A0A420AXS2_SPHD1|nr:hypothetical protein [Sphingobacterium detergens]RKE49282.1 hypothetical protein DFQ12_3393 [Sphingobacterium detergens]